MDTFNQNLIVRIDKILSNLKSGRGASLIEGSLQTLRRDCQVLTDHLEERDQALSEALKALEESNERLAQELKVVEERASEKAQEYRATFLGESIEVQALKASVEKYSNSDETLLLTGPRGAGEEAVAHAIHHQSERRGRPFIYIDCTRFNADQELSLFGSDEWETPDGKAYLADKGTLYMAQVEQLPKSGQWTLRAYLETAEKARKQGATPVPDIRIIVYARRDLMDLASEGKFDTELARLLTRLKLSVPALSERRDDIIPIAERFLTSGSRFYGKVVDGFDEAAKERLLSYSWPGNMHELDAVIRQSVIVTLNTTIEEMDIQLLGARRLGEYRLIKKLGEGGMGEVWLAKHEALGRTAAIKLIKPDIFDRNELDPKEVTTRFKREARVTAMLKSPHTVRLYDFGKAPDGGLYYVMEFLEGMDLDVMVEKYGPLSPARMLHFIKGAAYSLAEAHSAGLIHRDIKPANIFAAALGYHRDFPKLIDFGIVRKFKGNVTRITAAHVFPGTPEFSPPEMVTSPNNMDPCSDIYSLGCTAFYLVTGEVPFKGESEWAVMMAHTTAPPPRASAIRPELPAWIDDLLVEMMAKKPEDRPPSAETLIERIDAIPCDQLWSDKDAMAWWNEKGLMSTR